MQSPDIDQAHQQGIYDGNTKENDQMEPYSQGTDPLAPRKKGLTVEIKQEHLDILMNKLSNLVEGSERQQSEKKQEQVFQEIHERDPKWFTEQDSAVHLLLAWPDWVLEKYGLTREFVERRAGINV